MKIEFLTSLYSITLELVTEWNLDPDNSRKYIIFKSKFCFPIDMCINYVKETCFSKKYQKWIYQVLEMRSSIVAGAIVAGVIAIWGAIVIGAIVTPCGAFVIGVIIAGAFIVGAIIAGAIVVGVNFAGAIIAGVDFAGAFVAGAIIVAFSGANVVGAIVAGTQLCRITSDWPKHVYKRSDYSCGKVTK